MELLVVVVVADGGSKQYRVVKRMRMKDGNGSRNAQHCPPCTRSVLPIQKHYRKW